MPRKDNEKMAKKVLAIIRASTIKQEVESQKEELTAFLLTKGFTADDIVYLEAKGASAHLANKEYLQFLSDIRTTLESNPTIKTVGLWHLNRLGRIKMYLTQMEHYFVSNGIQMYVKNGFDMPLLGADGKETIGASIAFSVYSAMVEVETDELFEKTKRGLARNRAAGLYKGGIIKYGYTLDEHKRYIVNEDEAKVIRTLYDLYANTRIGQRQLRKEMESRGYKLTEDRIRKVLSDKGYIGNPYRPKTWSQTEKKYVEGNLIQYPAIIDEATFAKAAKKREGASKTVYRGTKYFFASGLIKCPLCGHAYTGFDYDNLYMCIAHRHSNTDIAQCENNVTINLTALDSLLWHLASAMHFKWMYENNEAQKENLRNEMEVLSEKIAREQAIIDGVEERLSDIAEMVIDRMMTKEKAKTKAESIRQEATEAEARINAYKQRQTAIDELLNNDEKSQSDALWKALEGILSVDALKEMSDIVHKYVTKVEVERYPYDDRGGKNGCGPRRVVKIHFIDGQIHQYLIYARGNDYRFTAYDLNTPEPENVKIIPRGKVGNSRLAPSKRKH